MDSLEKGPDVGEIAEVPDGQVRGVAQGKSHGTRERESISSGMRCVERRGDGGLGEQTKSNKNNYDVNARCLFPIRTPFKLLDASLLACWSTASHILQALSALKS